MPATSISSDLLIEGDTLIWRLCGMRPKSSQARGSVGRASNWRQASQARQGQRAVWESMLDAAKDEADIDRWVAPQPAQLVIYFWGPSPPDTPNIGWHAKYAIDALVTLGLIANDSPKYVPRTITEVVPRPKWATPGPGMEMRIEPRAA